MALTILVTGGRGQVGQELARYAWHDDVELVQPDRSALDLSDRSSIDTFMGGKRLSCVINCAAYTAVDKAEDEPDAAYAVNAHGAGYLARAARKANIPMIHVSTDYVLGPSSGRPHLEDDPVGPSSVYGASKLAGEIAVTAAWDRLVILRTAWVVSPLRSNFVKTMLRLAESRDEIDVVADQRGCPTGAHDIADALAAIAMIMIDNSAAPTGIYNFVNTGEASWAELAEAAMTEADRHGLPRAHIREISTADFPTRAQRPTDSRLDMTKIGRAYGISPRDWRTMVAATVAELAESQSSRNSE